jgi:stearoyl-CoA desaturase (delta-9 desaturase)
MVKIKLLYAYYIVAWVLLLVYWAIDINTWVNGLIAGWVFHMLVCSIVLHKYFTHRTFTVNPVLHKIFSYIGTLGLNGSVLAWANMHRLHHTTSDKAGDPHDPKNIGILRSLFVFDAKAYTNNAKLTNNLKNCRDLLKDKTVMFFHKYTFETITLTYVLLLLLDPKILVTFMIATAVSFIGLFFTTYVYHFNIPGLHYRNNTTTDNSHNNWLSTILFPGEAYHNNHHNNPSHYNTAEKWYEFDMSAILINILKRK